MNQLPSDFVLEKRRCETLPARAAISFMIALLMVNTVGPAIYFTYVEQHQEEPLPQPYFIDSLALTGILIGVCLFGYLSWCLNIYEHTGALPTFSMIGTKWMTQPLSSCDKKPY